MTTKNLFYHPVSWILFLIIAAGGMFYVIRNFEKANPLVSVHIQMDRETALEKAAQLAEEFEIGPADFKQAAAFRRDSRFQNFTELEGGGLDTFNLIISDGYYHPYYWSIRHFKEQEANEAMFWFKPSGELYGFQEKIPESEPGAALSEEEALRAAEHHAIYNWDVDLLPFELVEKSKTEQISGRVDHTFVYERTDKSLGDAKFRLKLIVSGDKLTAVNYYVKIPENFNRRYSEMRSANQTIQMISMAAIVLLYGILGVALGIFILIRKRRLIWKPAVYWGMGIAFVSVFLLSVNSLPFSWFSYDTSTSQSNFLLQQLFGGLMGAVGFGAVISLSFMAGEGLGRMAFPRHIQWWKLWSANSGGSLPVLGQTIAGYLFAAIILAFDVFFYVFTTKHFGWWSPAGTLSDPNVLATYLPWLDSIAISLQAGFWEEALFRAVPIAGIFILTKNKKSRTFWVVLILLAQTLIFGAAHANYAQQPSYARVIEMIVPFTIMGIIYIYYGILPAVIAHYAVDVFWISLPLWVTSETGIWIDRSLVLLFFMLPLFIVIYFRLKNGKWKKVQAEERNAAWQPPELPKIENQEEVEKEPAAPTSKLPGKKWILTAGMAGLALWIIFTPFKTDSPVLELPKKEAIEIAKAELRTRYQINFEEWTILSAVNSQLDTRDIFVWQTGSSEIYQDLFNSFLLPPHWLIRLVKISGSAEEKTEEFRVRVSNGGEVLNMEHIVPEETAGANLSQEEAQKIADAAIDLKYSINRRHLQEISVSPEKLANRTDWEFIYADTLNFPLEEGQGRYEVEISGNEVTNLYRYVHVPEDWSRQYKDEQSKKSIVQTIGNIVVAGALFFLVILGIIRWTRKKFHLEIFIRITLFFLLLFALETWLGWDSLLSSYNTRVPMGNFITMMLIGTVISGTIFSLLNGIMLGATPGWFPAVGPTKNSNLKYAPVIGFLTAGIWAVVLKIEPQTTPTWLSYSYLNDNISWLGLAVSRTTNIIFYPAFVMILYYGVNYFTKFWTTQKWAGVLILTIAGFGVTALSFNNFSSWLITGSIVTIFLTTAYILFFKFRFHWIPLSFGMIPLLKMLHEMMVVQNLTYIFGAFIMILVSSAILYLWSRLMVKHAPETQFF
jgi:hypothetical protein